MQFLMKSVAAVEVKFHSSSMPFMDLQDFHLLEAEILILQKLDVVMNLPNIPLEQTPDPEFLFIWRCWGCLVYILQGYLGVFLSLHLRHQHQPSTTFSMLRPERWGLASGRAGGPKLRGGKMSLRNFQKKSLGGGNSKICLSLCSSLFWGNDSI